MRRQAKPERAAGAFLALHADAAAVLLDNRLADRQSESGAALLARVGWIDLAKPLEDRAPMDGGHTAAMIDDAELRPLTV